MNTQVVHRFILATVLLFLLSCYTVFITMPDQPSQQVLTAKGQSILVDVVTTPEEQQRGLSGRESLSQGTGMLFPFAEKSIPSFWMKDMLFSIDIVWIADHQVVGIESRVPVDDGVLQYSPPIPVDSVLELPAGWSEEFGLGVGDDIR